MNLDEFEGKLVIFAKNSTERITPSNVSYYLKTSISEAKKYLEELANNAILNLEFDDNGNLYFDFPNMTRKDNKEELEILLEIKKEGQNIRHCPYCKKEVDANAEKCIHCNSIIDVTLLSSKRNYFGHRLATKGERFAAVLLGNLIIFTPILIASGRYLQSNTYNFIINIILAILIGGVFYPLWSGNLGHKIFGLKVISTENGKEIRDPISGIIRELSKSLLSYLILPIIWILWDDNNQNLYDKISNTIVVKKKNS